ncbi:AaceriAAL183Wp [[Ashbya] aceris (nom. inval.)]|nr:AaceriAAL183Wp [[Ashbya] aceris (nom. inval.)]
MASRTLPLFSKDTLQKHTDRSSCWVSVGNRKIYDVSQFLDEHPGGDQYILDYAGQDITAVLKDKLIHEHSEAAYEILDDSYLVGYLATEEEERKLLTNEKHVMEVTPEDVDTTKFVKELPAEEVLSVATDFGTDYTKHHFLDLNKPLLMQVLRGNFTRDFYIDQIHRPRHYGKGSAPLFGNFLEPLSKTAWWVVPTIWYPVVLYYLVRALRNMPTYLALTSFAVGVFAWTLIEYSLHRFLFHFDDNMPESNLAFTLHFLLHGVHHYLPMDKYRLVMPPALFVILCAPFYRLVFSIFPEYCACGCFAGGLFGYVCYDVTHYFLHHHKLPAFMRKLKKYHLEHHYKNYELGFGVTSWYWDKIFGTYLASDSPVSRSKCE